MFQAFSRDTIPALIKDEGDELIEQLVECQENLVRADLNAIQTAEHIVKQEELLSALGQRASREVTTVGKGQALGQKTLHEVWVSRRGRINTKRGF